MLEQCWKCWNNSKFTVNSKCYCEHKRTGNILIMITYLMMSKLSFLLMDCEMINCLHQDRSAQDPSEHLRRNFVQKQLATLISTLIRQKSESQNRVFHENKARQVFPKTNIFYSLIMYTYVLKNIILESFLQIIIKVSVSGVNIT